MSVMATEAKKSLGQHWLHDSLSLEAMCVAADIQQGDTVLEIGPGTGELTEKLLNYGAHVIALEIDERLHDELRQRFRQQSSFQLVAGDIRTYDLTQLPTSYKIAANIPYYLTSHLLRILSESPHPPDRAALLVQKEVAERVVADPGAMSLLSVSTQFYWQTSLGAVVPKSFFTPPPKVDSQVLILERRREPLFDVDEKQFFQLVRAGFSARRKKLRSSLAGGLHLAKPEVESLLSDAGVSADVRAQELSLAHWHKIYQAYQKTI